MPNEPRNPYAGLPWTAGIGFTFMALSAVVFVAREFGWEYRAIFASGIVAGGVGTMALRHLVGVMVIGRSGGLYRTGDENYGRTRNIRNLQDRPNTPAPESETAGRMLTN